MNALAESDWEADRQVRITRLKDLMEAAGLPPEVTAQANVKRVTRLDGTREWHYYACGSWFKSIAEVIERVMATSSQVPVAPQPARASPQRQRRDHVRPPHTQQRTAEPQAPRSHAVARPITMQKQRASRPSLDPRILALPAPQPAPRLALPAPPAHSPTVQRLAHPHKIVCLAKEADERVKLVREKLREAGLAADASAGIRVERVPRPKGPPGRVDWWYTAHGHSMRSDRIDKLIKKIQGVKRHRQDIKSDDEYDEEYVSGGYSAERDKAARPSPALRINKLPRRRPNPPAAILQQQPSSARSPAQRLACATTPAAATPRVGLEDAAHGVDGSDTTTADHLALDWEPSADAAAELKNLHVAATDAHHAPPVGADDDPVLLDLNIHPDLLTHFASFTNTLCERYKHERLLEQRVRDLEAEVAALQADGDAQKLREENMQLRSEKAQLKSEVAQLKEELRDQKGKMDAIKRTLFAA